MAAANGLIGNAEAGGFPPSGMLKGDAEATGAGGVLGAEVRVPAIIAESRAAGSWTDRGSCGDTGP